MDSSEGEKIARTESLFREVNERIAESAERFDADETKFVCECADPTCTHRVEATLEEYERVREDGATFLLVNGHEDERIEADRARGRRPRRRREAASARRAVRPQVEPAHVLG